MVLVHLGRIVGRIPLLGRVRLDDRVRYLAQLVLGHAGRVHQIELQVLGQLAGPDASAPIGW